MKVDYSDPGAHWLAGTHRTPWAVWEEWERSTYALLPAGRDWDVVTAQLQDLDRAMRRSRPAWEDVPVLRDLGAGRGYVWVPTGTAAAWPQDARGTRALGDPWWVAVPRPAGPQVPERRWHRPPGAIPALMDPIILRETLGIEAAPEPLEAT
ncbi:hypothetical protein [Streptomyces virginiae]|uniref:hypothetical protein n=1 Tax=Streptomyces virginiae TaxID=1961 RepID=UPI00369FACA8